MISQIAPPVEELAASGSECNQMNEAVRPPEARNQAVFESAFDVIFHLDKNGRLLDINRRVEGLTGYSRTELLRRRWRRRFTAFVSCWLQTRPA